MNNFQETVTDGVIPSDCQMEVHRTGDPDVTVDNDTGGHCCDSAHNANAISLRHDWMDPSFQLNVPLVDVDKITGFGEEELSTQFHFCFQSKGQKERDECYKPILEELQRLFPIRSKDSYSQRHPIYS
ncbi:hypothetical protein Taro_025223 [Colocasia esculenta]|uniref:Uncharacterized protein n=1 Tax=Colocasia esculenta TaxID=4460 RepID=A0A843V9L7_COLES|nr:hypothetical protein [Colocasia esculenta]